MVRGKWVVVRGSLVDFWTTYLDPFFEIYGMD